MGGWLHGDVNVQVGDERTEQNGWSVGRADDDPEVWSSVTVAT